MMRQHLMQRARLGLAAPSVRRLSAKPSDTGSSGFQKTIKNILHGDEEARSNADTTHSKLLQRGSYVHEKMIHNVKPEAWQEYVALVSHEHARICADPRFKAKLFGSWETELGSLDTAVHIWQFDDYPSYTEAMSLLKKDDQYLSFRRALAPLLRSRSNQMMLEFSFWDHPASTAPVATGGIYELRQYRLKPGRLLEWEQEWRKGLEARRKFVQPIGAWFGQLGTLNLVHHMWAYPDLQFRKEMREAAWQVDGWSSTVSNTVQLIDEMECQILRAMPGSPLS